MTKPSHQLSEAPGAVSLLFAVRDAVGLSTTEKAVAFVLVSHRNAKTGQCNLSIEVIAAKACVNARTVKRATASLVERGLISVVWRKNQMQLQASNQYNFHHKKWLELSFIFSGSGEGGDTVSTSDSGSCNASNCGGDTVSQNGSESGQRIHQSGHSVQTSGQRVLQSGHSVTLSSFRSSIRSSIEDIKDDGFSGLPEVKRKPPTQAERMNAVAYYDLSPEDVRVLVADYVAAGQQSDAELCTFNEYVSRLTGSERKGAYQDIKSEQGDYRTRNPLRSRRGSEV